MFCAVDRVKIENDRLPHRHTNTQNVPFHNCSLNIHSQTDWNSFYEFILYSMIITHHTRSFSLQQQTTKMKRTNEINQTNEENEAYERRKKKRMTNCSKSMETIFFSVNGGFVAMLSTRDAGISVQLNRLSFELVLFRYFFSFHILICWFFPSS